MVSFKRLLLTLPLAVTALAQSRSGCGLLTLDEVTALLGPGTEQREAAGSCIFTSKKAAVTVNATPNAGTLIKAMRLTATQNSATVKDEPGIGNEAFSVVGKDGRGFTIFLLKGTWGSTVSSDAGAAKVPETIRQGLRALAKKVAARL